MNTILLFYNMFMNTLGIFFNLMPFGFFHNLSYFVDLYSDPVTITVLFLISTLFGMVFLLYFLDFLALPIDAPSNDGKEEQDSKKKTSFLGEILRFVFGASNVITFWRACVTYFGTLGAWKVVPVILLISLMYIPFVPHTDTNNGPYYTVGQYVSTYKYTIQNGVIGFLGGKTSDLKALSAAELSNGKISVSDSGMLAALTSDAASYDTTTTTAEDKAAKLAEIDKKIASIDTQIAGKPKGSSDIDSLNALKQAWIANKTAVVEGSKVRTTPTFFNGKVQYLGTTLGEQYAFATEIIGYILMFLWWVVMILISGWKNVAVLYIVVMSNIRKRFEAFASNKRFAPLFGLKKILSDANVDLRELEWLEAHGEFKEAYLILAAEVLVRFFLCYVFIYFAF